MKKLLQKLEMISWQLGPASLTLLLVFASFFPKRINGFADFVPLFAVISIYYWGLFKPESIPNWFLFLIGLFQDSVTGTALGTSALIFIVFRMVVISQRKVFSREQFWAMWVGFILLSVPVFSGYWLVLCFVHGTLMPMMAGIVQWAATAAFYPLVHVLFNRMYATMPTKTL